MNTNPKPFMWKATEVSAGAREMISDPARNVAVSAVTAWEIAVKTRLGRLDGGAAGLGVAADQPQQSRFGALREELPERQIFGAGGWFAGGYLV